MSSALFHDDAIVSVARTSTRPLWLAGSHKWMLLSRGEMHRLRWGLCARGEGFLFLFLIVNVDVIVILVDVDIIVKVET